jgi:hypothetical protein
MFSCRIILKEYTYMSLTVGWSQFMRTALSVPYKSGTPTYKLQIKTRSGVCTHMSPHVLQHWTLPPRQGGLRGCHMPSGYGSHLPDGKRSDATTCTVAPNPASLQGRAPVHHVSYSSGSCLPIGECSATATACLRFLVDRRS